MQSKMDCQSQRYVALDGLRGIAAYTVVMFHLSGYGIYPFKSPNHAVDLFFIMSGFVIASAYEKRLPELGFKEFMKRRLLRLYPTYLLALLILPVFATFGFMISRGKMSITAMILSIPFQALYLPSPRFLVPAHRSFFLLNGPAWSLFWEIAVNAGYAALVLVLTTRRLAIIVSLAGGWLMYRLFEGASIDTGSDWPTWYVGAARVLFGFPLGVLIFRCERPRFFTPFWALALLFGVTLFLPSLLSLFVMMPLIVWLATSSSARHPIYELLGVISYPLYAIHGPMTPPVDWLLRHLWRSIDTPLIGMIDLVFCSGVAWLVATKWDGPVRKWLERRLLTRQIAAFPVPAA